MLNGRSVLSFASNDYLGLASDVRLAHAASEAMKVFGAGASASPLIVGHSQFHADLERELATFKQTESALVFPSGYQASLATLGALATSDDTIILDRLAHACLIDGARLSGARVRTFKHNDLESLITLLVKERGRRCLVVVESLYSMDGDEAPLRNFAKATALEDALLLVDEAHATGVLGPNGRGALELIATEENVMPDHIVAMGTLSKALGSQGGYLCGPRWVTDAILHSGRAYMFSTALSPACVGAAREALRLLQAEPARREQVLFYAGYVRSELLARKFELVSGRSPIIPVILGDETRAIEASRFLLEEKGILVPAIRYPTVKKGQARLRISLSAAHVELDVAKLVNALSRLCSV
jgi:8-amino-7-oxononanoate synthase